MANHDELTDFFADFQIDSDDDDDNNNAGGVGNKEILDNIDISLDIDVDDDPLGILMEKATKGSSTSLVQNESHDSCTAAAVNVSDTGRKVGASASGNDRQGPSTTSSTSPALTAAETPLASTATSSALNSAHSSATVSPSVSTSAMAPAPSALKKKTVSATEDPLSAFNSAVSSFGIGRAGESATNNVIGSNNINRVNNGVAAAQAQAQTQASLNNYTTINPQSTNGTPTSIAYPKTSSEAAAAASQGVSKFVSKTQSFTSSFSSFASKFSDAVATAAANVPTTGSTSISGTAGGGIAAATCFHHARVQVER